MNILNTGITLTEYKDVNIPENKREVNSLIKIFEIFDQFVKRANFC